VLELLLRDTAKKDTGRQEPARGVGRFASRGVKKKARVWHRRDYMTDFLVNPINTGIVGFVVLFIFGGVVWFLGRRNIRISKGGVEIDNAARIDGRFLDRIPAIDEERKTRMRMEIYNKKDVWLGLMHEIKDRTIRQFLLLKFLDVITTKIFGNHLTVIFSDKAQYNIWKDEVIAMVMAKMRYVEDYTGIIQHDAEGLDDVQYKELLQGELEEVIASVRSVMKFVITESCEEKITFYREILQSRPNEEQAAKTKELIERNEGYIKRLAEF
jgi:hypothetical protein